MAKVTINDLLEAGCHFGHQTRRCIPKMKIYVYGAKNGISIIDLIKTMYKIAAACNVLQNVVVKGGDILFVGTKRQARDLTKELAAKPDMGDGSERWRGGTLTITVTIRKSITKMAETDEVLKSDSAAGMKKKELSLLARNAEKLHRDLDGIASMKRLPAALVIIDVCHEINAVREANKLGIPIVAIVDTNGDPSLVDYPVAANDDAIKSLQIITTLFTDAILIAKEVYQKRMIEEKTARGAAEKAAQEVAEETEAADKPKRAPRKPKAEGEAAAAPAAADKPKRAPRKPKAEGETEAAAAPAAEDKAE